MSSSHDSHGHGHDKDPKGKYLLTLCLSALGIVYGDIGTSPLYAFRECFHGEHHLALNEANILGVLSLMFWSLTLVVTLKYLTYVMRADNEGEGGVLALMALATSTGKRKGLVYSFVILMGLFGAALLYGDGMITPAISVLSAVEGLEVATPALKPYVVPITIGILVCLFLVQKRGTAGIGAVFGPMTLIWFSVLVVLGITQMVKNPAVVKALNPLYAAKFFINNGTPGFLVLGAVFLVVTGGEALYADMGHFGLKPIRLTWYFLVLPALMVNYFGQGALLIAHPEAIKNPFFTMAPSWAVYPLVILSTFATVIASQAVISGAFSLTKQAMMLGYWPRVAIEHTSDREIGQIYVPSVNWLLMVATIGLVVGFGSSQKLAAAYGIAVTTTMVITTVLAYLVATRNWGLNKGVAIGLTILLLVPDLAFFGANLTKVAEGGYFPLGVAALVLLMMTTWKQGRELLGKRIAEQSVPIADFLGSLEKKQPARVEGTAVYMVRSAHGTPPALLQNFEHNKVLHEEVVLLTISSETVPRISEDKRVTVEPLSHGFTRVIAHYGFTETPDVPAILAREDTPTPPIEETTFVLGRETVLPEGTSGMAGWRQRFFAFLSRNARRPTEFFAIPHERVIEVGAQVKLLPMGRVAGGSPRWAPAWSNQTCRPTGRLDLV